MSRKLVEALFAGQVVVFLLSGCNLMPWYRNRQTNSHIILEPQPVITSFVPKTIDESIEMPREGSSVYGVIKKETNLLELKITDYLDQKTSQEVFESVMFHTLDVRIKSSEDWQRVTQYTSQDGFIHTGDGGIIVFSDMEVGVATFGKPYFLTLDGGKTWQSWEPSNSWDIYRGDPGLHDFEMTREGIGTIVFDDVAGKSKRYTFTTVDKGLSWQLAKVEEATKD